MVKELVGGLLAQGLEKVDITKGVTRLTKLICRYLDTDSLTRNDEILPKSVSMDSSRNHRRSLSQPPNEPVSVTDVQSSGHTLSSKTPELIPFRHALHSQQPYSIAADTCTNTAKRRRVSEGERKQLPTICSILTQQDNISTTQAGRWNLTTGVSTHAGQHQDSSICPEKAGSIDQERVRPILLVVPCGESLPSSEDMEKRQDTGLAYSEVYTGEPMVGQQLLASHSGPSRSVFGQANTQQTSPVDRYLPLPPNSNAEAEFTSYAIDFVHTLDYDARLAFGLLSSPQQR